MDTNLQSSSVNRHLPSRKYGQGTIDLWVGFINNTLTCTEYNTEYSHIYFIKLQPNLSLNCPHWSAFAYQYDSKGKNQCKKSRKRGEERKLFKWVWKLIFFASGTESHEVLNLFTLFWKVLALYNRTVTRKWLVFKTCFWQKSQGQMGLTYSNSKKYIHNIIFIVHRTSSWELGHLFIKKIWYVQMITFSILMVTIISETEINIIFHFCLKLSQFNCKHQIYKFHKTLNYIV